MYDGIFMLMVVGSASTAAPIKSGLSMPAHWKTMYM